MVCTSVRLTKTSTPSILMAGSLLLWFPCQGNQRKGSPVPILDPDPFLDPIRGRARGVVRHP